MIFVNSWPILVIVLFLVVGPEFDRVVHDTDLDTDCLLLS